ncbi:VanZ family protein [Corynebacterium sp. MSK105]|uniref:VanZ family protein n=1 Tax=unclassified Corynebacterium TaxID=2624378 RepID=UPI00254FFFA8|nr:MULTISPECIES: VanZ family protein [unclassified Corynebacterium]MDK8482858.1 VanZ family protein [Corynebacterium sp. MSK074]MDK8525018.1 VanZ family protein [Corynebacterium sp. MSK150]MDK8690336.1 VanZ family protein [Corynebacterium sp. MSK105]
MTMTTMSTRTSRQIGARGMPAKRTLWRSAAVACVVVIVAIAVATVGKPFIDIPGVVDASAHARRSLDLQMFNGFNNPHPWWGPWTNTFGNIALFMPLGACLVVLGQNSRRIRFGRGGTILLAMALSLGIEITQYVFSLGFSDVDDLVFNTLGASLGAFLLSRSSFKAQLRAVRFIGWTAAAGLGALAAVILAGVIV